MLASAQAAEDTVLRAMRDEIARARTLSIASLDDPYYVEYTMEDVNSFSVSAGLGALLARSESHFRVPRVRVRVGDYKFDNANYVLSEFYSGARYDPEQFPIENDYHVLRRSFWLATDRAFKTAVEAIARKRAALKNVTQNEELPDFWKATPVQRIEPVPAVSVAADKWVARVRSLSEAFLGYPEVLSSMVTLNANRSVYYFLNSEGTAMRRPEPLIHFQVQARALTPDGATVRDSVSLPRPDERSLPDEAALKGLVTEVADNVRALLKAPAGETYSGPVLFEGIAGAQVIAELLAPNLALGRRPVAEPGRPMNFLASELEGRIGSRVLPDFLDVVDDPTQAAWNGAPLMGHYSVDEEGVAAQPVKVIEKGQLKSFLLTRQPVKGFEASNGRARMPGAFGARTASVSNLFVYASQAVRPAELRKSLLDMISARNKPYGIVVRKMDFPSSGGGEELRKMVAASRSGGNVRPVSAPLLIYRVYPDGREELIRGVRFRNLTVRSLRDITAVSDDTRVLHYLNNGAPMALLGAGSYVAPVSVVAPSLLFEDLEIERPQDDQPTLPLVAAPELTARSN
jgi:predicted Zn-dependent protease